MDKSLLQAAQVTIENADSVLIVSHTRPDGDAVGSVLALGLALAAVGKPVHMVLEDGVPKVFRHLSGTEQIRKRAVDDADCVIVVDCSDLDRTGKVLDDYPAPDISIDHHNTNLNFARINLVDSSSCATAEMLAKLIPSWGFPVTPSVAEALLTGIITDSLGFRVPGTSPNTLRIAADLYEIGANLPELYLKALHNRSVKAVRYWGVGLASLQLDERILWTQLTLKDRESINYPGRDDADLINVLQTVEDADIFVIFIEQNSDSVKVSWRARPGYDVSKIAFQFGGGGHKPAAGAEIKGSIGEVTEQVLAATHTLLNGDSA